MSIHKWIPKGQNFHDWKEMITVAFQKCGPIDMTELEKNLISSFDKYSGYPYTAETIKKESDELVIKICVPYGHESIPRFSTIYRYLASADGIHSVIYEKRFKNIDDEEQKTWFNKLQKAYLASNSELNQVCQDTSKGCILTDNFNRILKNDFGIDEKMILDIQENEFNQYKIIENDIDKKEGRIQLTWVSNNQTKRNCSEEISLCFLQTPKNRQTPIAIEFAESYVNRMRSKSNLDDFTAEIFPNDIDDVMIQMAFFGTRRHEPPRVILMRMLHTQQGHYSIMYTKYKSHNGIFYGDPAPDIQKWNLIIGNTSLASLEYFPQNIDDNTQCYFEKITPNQKNNWILVKKTPSRNGYYLKEWIPETQQPNQLKDSLVIVCSAPKENFEFSLEEPELQAKAFAEHIAQGKPHTINIIDKGVDFIAYEIYAPQGTIDGGLKYCLRYEFLSEDKSHWCVSVGKDREMSRSEQLGWIERIRKANREPKNSKLRNLADLF